MSVDWLDIATVMAAVVLTWVPGLVVARCAGLRGLYAVAIGPALTLGAVAIATLALQVIGARWSIWWLLGATAVLAGVGLLLNRWRRLAVEPNGDGSSWSPRARWVLLGIGAGAALVAGWVYARTSGGFSVVPQDFDHVFQANAIRYINTSGDPSPLGLRAVNDYESSGAYYYPSAWHALGALLMPIAGGDVLRVLHSLVLVWFLALPLGIASAARSVRLPVIGTGVALALSTCMANLPWELLWRGVLPFAASLAFLLPVVVVAVEGARRRSAAWGLVAAASAFGLVSVHTSALMTLAVFGGPALVWAVIRAKGSRWRTVAWMGAVAAVLIAGLVPALLIMRQVLGGVAVDWTAVVSMRDGVDRAFEFVGAYRPTRLANLGWAVVPGMLLAFRRRYRWAGMLALSTAFAMCLFVLAAASDSALSSFLTQWWWNDHVRLGAVSAVAAPLFAGIVVQEIRGLGTWASDRVHATGRVRTAIVHLPWIAFCVPLAVIGMKSLADGQLFLSVKYTDGPTVSREEVAAYEYLAEQGIEGRVMNDPADGSAWMYALKGVRPVYGQFAVAGNSPDQEVLYNHFDEFDTDPQVRRAVEELGIEYVIVGRGTVFRNQPLAPGLDHLADRPDVFEVVFHNRDATVYRILAPTG